MEVSTVLPGALLSNWWGGVERASAGISAVQIRLVVDPQHRTINVRVLDFKHSFGDDAARLLLDAPMSPIPQGWPQDVRGYRPRYYHLVMKTDVSCADKFSSATIRRIQATLPMGSRDISHELIRRHPGWTLDDFIRQADCRFAVRVPKSEPVLCDSTLIC